MSLILSQRSGSNFLVSKLFLIFRYQCCMKLCLKHLMYVSSKQGGKENIQVFVKVVLLFAVPLSSEKLFGVKTNRVCEVIVDVVVTVYYPLITIKCSFSYSWV